MLRDRIIEYPNELSQGPLGLEYLLPVELEAASGLSPWTRSFASLRPEQVFGGLSSRWEPVHGLARPVAGFFSTLQPASIYVLPDEWCPNSEWVLLKSDVHVYFFAEPQKVPEVVGEFGEDLAVLLGAFSGTRIGFRFYEAEGFLRQDSGFTPAAELRVLSEADEPFLWGNDRSLLGSLPFFGTPCGNRFLALRSGAIAKWEHGSAAITVEFEGIGEFVEEFVAFYSRATEPNESSPFFL